MKKRHRIAAAALLACLACAGAASAQSGVTLYGVADASVEFVNHAGTVPTAANGFNSGPANQVVRLNSGGLSGSRWGLRGVEDLGQGLKVNFVLESGFNLDTGTLQQSGRLFGRQAFVGLQSATLGQLSLGRQYTSLFDSMANFVPAYFATQYEPVVMLTGANFREDNTIKYSGTFGALTAVAHWSFGTGLALPQVVAGGAAIGGNGENPGQFRRDSAYGAALTYGAGPLAAALGYDQFNPSIGSGSGSGSFRKAAVALSYSFGPARLIGGYRWGQNQGATGAVIGRDDYYWVGGIYQVTPALSLTLEYAYDNLKNLYGNSALANPWQLNLIAGYSLSKRTDLYFTAAYARNAGLALDSASIGFANSLSLGNSYAPASGQSSMLGMAVGIRHKF
ncbi:hypothetical protein BKK79_26600 [Cupriavidus sp. USMAA2-4]|uniref:porin n=1 Tax=Cupriavidus sp. USMAA2-4 TaxID=876364 RepID=UPI0008A6F78B|nr:porin [Cupriavidus sp. USMAA2-4]AOY95345.1 hypothetical protein BKK79_26600 [Cupriavidus sp. USMAA2-4]